MRKQVNFISWLRFFAVICILVCHLVQTSSISPIRMSAQFFNIGVEIFILISGFCFGLQGKISDIKAWYIKRIKRIYIPYEIFLAVLAIVYLIVGREFEGRKWLWCISGLLVPVKGVTHAWFIATILLCYCITPILILLCRKKDKKIVTYLALLLMPLVVSLIPNDTLAAYLPHVFFYSIAYLYGYEYKEITMDFKKITCCVVTSVMAAIIRIAGRVMFDGTILYDRIICKYTQYVIAFSLFFIFGMIFNQVKPGKVCEYVCKISFEIYLCHYMFIVGPISLMNVTPYWLMNCAIVVTVSFLLASLLNIVNAKLIKLLN